MCNRNTSVLRHALTAAVALAVCGANSFAFGDEAAQIGREGQAFGKQLSNEFSFPTESGGSFNLGNGTTIGPSDLAPSGDGLYVQDPDVQGMRGIYDSDYDMDVTGRAAQGKLYSDAQAKGNPFDPDPAKRDAPGPSTVSGAAYQVILGVSDARNEIPDLSNDPIISGSGDAMLDDSLLESFGDCSVETEVTETTRPVHMPEEEYCERVITPAPTTCTIKRELVLERTIQSVSSNATNSAEMNCSRFRGYYVRVGGIAYYDWLSERRGITQPSFTFPELSDICMNIPDGTRINGLSAQVQSLNGMVTSVSNDDNMEGRCVSVGMNYYGRPVFQIGLSQPVCRSGVPEVTLNSASLVSNHPYGPFFGFNIGSLTLRVHGTVDVTTVAKDNWYPEECIARAKKAK